MTSCNGNGECLMQCDCECFNKETDEYDEICVCGHREHNGYCPSNCCELVKCRNYEYCGEKLPKWVTYCHNGMSMSCAAKMGTHKTTDTADDCPVCLENKNMILLNCNHKVCNDCWYKITEVNATLTCPLCRYQNRW